MTAALDRARARLDTPPTTPIPGQLDLTRSNHMTESPDPYANGVCPYGEDWAPGSGCIKPVGHDGAHLVTPGDADSDDD